MSPNCTLMPTNCTFLLEEQEKFSRPVPAIGVYIAVASLVCTLAMTADIFRGIRQRKFMFPCKYFTLNAASLTVIAVAMKLPVDLTSSMPSRVDQLSKLTGTCFLCTMLANFMPSLGPMNNTELLSNVIAVVILVITIVVNICIQLSSTLIDPGWLPFHVIVVTFMLSLLVIFVSSALAVPGSKSKLEIKYREMYKQALDEESKHPEMPIVDKLMQRVEKYWIMAETGSPQFVMACSPTCSACGAICLFIAFLLILLVPIMLVLANDPDQLRKSDYDGSIIPIVVIQTIGVIVGSIALVFRWFSALTFKLSLKWCKNYFKVLVVEKYWTQRLIDWKSTRVPIDIGGHKRKRIVHGVWNLVLNLIIWFQVTTVVVCKTLQLIPIFFVIMVVCFWHLCKWLKHYLLTGKNNFKGSESEQRVSTKPDLSPYVLRLQDEVELASRTLRRFSKAVNRLIHKAEKHQAENLKKLLKKSTGFQGVAEFDNDQVQPLQSQEQVSNCWSLVVVNLTSVALALPFVEKDKADLLLRGVSEGLSYVTLVEEMLFVNKGDMVHIIKAARNVWLNVRFHKKWLGNNLQEVHADQQEKTPMEIFTRLGDIAKNINVTELRKSEKRGLEDDARQKLIAANSMYRISRTLLLDNQRKGYNTNEMFEKLSVMIADILGACLTNLPHVITTKCHTVSIEKREESVKIAARVLGQTKGIIEILDERRKLSNLNHDQTMVNIDGWRDMVKYQNNESISSTSCEQFLLSSLCRIRPTSTQYIRRPLHSEKTNDLRDFRERDCAARTADVLRDVSTSPTSLTSSFLDFVFCSLLCFSLVFL